MVTSVTHLLWVSAGRPIDTTAAAGGPVDAVQVPGARCWWCGHPSPDSWSRSRSCLPDTFPYPLEAAVPESPWLCLPCGWTLCDRVALPREVAEDRIRRRARAGGRLVVSVRGAPAERWLILERGGAVLLWRPGANAGAEEPWLEAVARGEVPPGAIDEVAYGDLAPDATEKFRAYHHLATPDRWWPCTDTERAGIRAWLLAPPPPPWVAVIGDGKKHSAIDAQRLDAVATTAELGVAYYRGAVVRYAPADLAALVDAVEGLVRAGAGDEEVETGRYAPRGLDLLTATRRWDPVVAPYRGGPTLDLALYLRRNRKELGC